jgi:hypothetical protein
VTPYLQLQSAREEILLTATVDEKRATSAST